MERALLLFSFTLVLLAFTSKELRRREGRKSFTIALTSRTSFEKHLESEKLITDCMILTVAYVGCGRGRWLASFLFRSACEKAGSVRFIAQ